MTCKTPDPLEPTPALSWRSPAGRPYCLTQRCRSDVNTLRHNYIEVFGFTGAAKLITSFGYRTAVSAAEREAAIQSALAERPFKKWMGQLRWQHLPSFQKLAEMLLKHLEGILNYCRTRVRFGVVEAINDNIRMLINRGRGYRNMRCLLLKARSMAVTNSEYAAFQRPRKPHRMRLLPKSCGEPQYRLADSRELGRSRPNRRRMHNGFPAIA